VRDLSRHAGKSVELVFTGDETELDRKVVEEITDPLMHMIRNSLDHGIEPEAERRRAGKPLTGRVELSAAHAAGSIVITVADDGRGLQEDRILAKAIERGMVPAGAQLTPAEVHQLIFRPGFSTATDVTAISGRGVGMDVVRRNIETLRGRVDIASTPGAGTRFLIKLPLTLAIVEGLLVAVGTERYVIPTFAVRESLRPRPDQVHHVQGAPRMIRVRDSLVPMVRLASLFGAGDPGRPPSELVAVVIEDDGRRVAVLVERLLGKQEVVVKSLGDAFKHVRGVAGAAILGDGQVGLILDAGGVLALMDPGAAAA
jgi:two-component system chemotaxis sensor kinase CheA